VPTVVAAGFGRPRGVAKIAGGNLFLADRLRSIVGVLTVDGGAFTYLAGASGDAGFGDGNGAAAQFNGPLGAAAMSDGSVLVADSANNRIRRVTALGEVTTFAGDGTAGWKDGARLSAELSLPTDVAVDAADNVYITDAGNHVVRRILANGTMVTLAGDGTQSFANGAGDLAEFYGLEGIDVTADGKTVYVSDGNEGDGSAHHRVRKIVVP
jgi:DNA-binding beta-propeller fold protein YncE